MAKDITIFTCKSVAEYCHEYYDNGLKSARVVENHLQDCLEYWNYTPNITISNDTSYTVQKSNMSDELQYFHNEWLEGHSDESTDSNLMLLSDSPSGYAGLATGNASLKKWGEDIADHSYSADRYGDPSFDDESRIRGSIHEVGHNYGMSHGDGRRFSPGAESDTYATPHGCEINGTVQSENRCGDSCSTKSIDIFDHYYADCAENNL